MATPKLFPLKTGLRRTWNKKLCLETAFYNYHKISHSLLCFRLLIPMMSHVWDKVKADALVICPRIRCSIRLLLIHERVSLCIRSFAIFCLSPLVGGRCPAPESDIQKWDSKFWLKLICSVESLREINGEPLPKVSMTDRNKRLERVAWIHYDGWACYGMCCLYCHSTM